MSTEFGGGLARFVTCPSEVNTCRELVEVPGGAEWKIRKFQEIHEEFCWKYPGSSVIVNYHFKRLQNCESPEDENQRMFYAKVSHFMSPVEISVQPKYLSSARKSLMGQMNACYQHTRPEPFLDEQIFVPVACAVQELGFWYRGRIVQISGEEHVVVELVDFGTQILVPRRQILPLFRRFGKAPPLCLKCRADGISINDLEIRDLHDFKDVVAGCNALFRVELKSCVEPFKVDLYHPTISGLNVCAKFMPPPEDVGKMERYERSWEAHCKKMNEEFEDDVDLDADDVGTGDHLRRFMKRLPKCERAPRFEHDVLLVEHIENSQLVYLQYPWQHEKRAELDRLLCATWHRLAPLPREFRVADQVCAIRNPRLGGVVRRAIICEDPTTVLLVDYGRFVRCCSSADLRSLPAEGLFAEEPMITVISMTRGINLMTPHHSETQFLREKLRHGAKVHFRWDKKSKQTPLRGKLFVDGQRDSSINDQMVNYLKRAGIDANCHQLDVYRPRAFHTLPRGNHVYRATCHAHYSKGSEEFFEI
ncbi:unnamed protein product [Caenorhabditis sp. 36 PRJEB53466]|nr:unnamed protein product [Caenorhabditis sp. 36 PRJEB53466]